MSGSGGGNGGGPIGPDETIDCAKLFERTNLNSPDSAVLEHLKPGDVLSITVDARGVIRAVTHAGKTAGSITSSRMLQLIECIEKGHSYVAVVQSVSGGKCEVEIRPESK